MPQSAVEHPAFTIVLDPNQSVVLIRTNVPLAQVRLLGIDTDKNVQLLARVRSRGQKMIKLICPGESFTA